MDKKKDKKKNKRESESSVRSIQLVIEATIIAIIQLYLLKGSEYEWVEKKAQESNKQSKPMVKGPMLPPKDVDLSEIAREQEAQVRLSNNWLGGGDDDDSELNNLFGKSNSLKIKQEGFDSIKNFPSAKQDDNQTSKSLKSNENIVLIATKTDRFGNEIPLTKAELEQINESQSRDHRDRKRQKVSIILFHIIHYFEYNS